MKIKKLWLVGLSVSLFLISCSKKDIAEEHPKHIQYTEFDPDL